MLEDKRQMLNRAIQALTEAEAAVASGASSTTAILQEVIRVMETQDVDVMRKYYSDEAWEAWKHHYEDWPPDEWRALYKDIIAGIGSDPKGPVAQAHVVSRWRLDPGFRADEPGSAVSDREVAGTRRGRNAVRRRAQAGRAGCALTPTRVARWNETIHRVAV